MDEPYYTVYDGRCLIQVLRDWLFVSTDLLHGLMQGSNVQSGSMDVVEYFRKVLWQTHVRMTGKIVAHPMKSNDDNGFLLLDTSNDAPDGMLRSKSGFVGKIPKICSIYRHDVVQVLTGAYIAVVLPDDAELVRCGMATGQRKRMRVQAMIKQILSVLFHFMMHCRIIAIWQIYMMQRMTACFPAKIHFQLCYLQPGKVAWQTDPLAVDKTGG